MLCLKGGNFKSNPASCGAVLSRGNSKSTEGNIVHQFRSTCIRLFFLLLHHLYTMRLISLQSMRAIMKGSFTIVKIIETILKCVFH